MADLAWFGLLVAGLAVSGVVLGRLVAPAITRWAERDDEDDGPGDDPNDRNRD